MNFNEFSGDVIQRGGQNSLPPPPQMLKKQKKIVNRLQNFAVGVSVPSSISTGQSAAVARRSTKHFDLFMATRSTRKVTSAPQALQQVVGSGPAGRQLADWNQSSHRWNAAGPARFTR